MTPDVRAEYTDAVRAGVAAAVGVAPGELRDLGGFESFVHETEVRGRPHIVKATWSGRRTPEEIGAELHFVNYLADAGAPACRALPLASGELVATVPSTTGSFHVTAYAKAQGAPKQRVDFDADLMRRWGAVVGQFHRLAAEYPGPPAPLARPSWEVEIGGLGDLVAHEPECHEPYLALMTELRALPRERGAFGAMHTDLHRWNIYWDGARPYVFDFEDMVDFWFISDLAIVLYYAVMTPIDPPERQELYDAWKRPLLEGYGEEWTLPDWSWDALPLFLSLREQVLRAVMLRSMPEDERSPGQVRYLSEASARVAAGEPALGLRA